jgi:hypothetical protein
MYSLLNQQIFTLTGKLGQKIPKLHPTSYIASISIPKKFHMISNNLYNTSDIGMNISCDSQWHVWDMYASVAKCIITFSESLETFLTTYFFKRRSSSKISDFLSKVTSFLHLFFIKSTNIYNNRQAWSENSEISPNILDCIH